MSRVGVGIALTQVVPLPSSESDISNLPDCSKLVSDNHTRARRNSTALSWWMGCPREAQPLCQEKCM